MMNIVVSADKMGMIEYWTSHRDDYKFPSNVLFESKLDTDLYEIAKVKTVVVNIEFSRDGKSMAVMSKDRNIRIYNVLTGKITQTINESLDVYSTIQQVRIE